MALTAAAARFLEKLRAMGATGGKRPAPPSAAPAPAPPSAPRRKSPCSRATLAYVERRAARLAAPAAAGGSAPAPPPAAPRRPPAAGRRRKAPPTRAEIEKVGARTIFDNLTARAAAGRGGERPPQPSIPGVPARPSPSPSPASPALPLAFGPAAPGDQKAIRTSAAPAAPGAPLPAPPSPGGAAAPATAPPPLSPVGPAAALQQALDGLPALPPAAAPEPEPRPLPLGFRVPRAPGFAVAVSAPMAEAAEEAAGRRGPMSDLTAALHRRRWRHRRARRVPRGARCEVARRYGLPGSVVDRMARRIEAAIPPAATARGKRAIQAARGRASGAARRAGCRARDLLAVDGLRRRKMTVRAVARALECSPSTVVGAAERLRTGEVDHAEWQAARRERRAVVRAFWRAHYGNGGECGRAGCRCQDGARRGAEQRRRAGSAPATVPGADADITAAGLRLDRAEREQLRQRSRGAIDADRRTLSLRDPNTEAAGAGAPRSSAGVRRREREPAPAPAPAPGGGPLPENGRSGDANAGGESSPSQTGTGRC